MFKNAIEKILIGKMNENGERTKIKLSRRRKIRMRKTSSRVV